MIDVRVDGAVCTVTLDRPERLNALHDGMRARLQETADRLRWDTDVRVVLFEGRGRAFSVGADLRDSAPWPTDWVGRRHAAGLWHRVLDDLERLPQVTVAKLHGHVVGGGVVLATTCDLRVAAADLRLSVPEVPIGVPLTWAGLPRLVREVGLSVTRDLVMTGRVIEAEEALARGLVHRVVPRDRLDEETVTLVERLVATPAGPLAMTRAALAAMGRDVGGFAAAWADPDVLAWSLADPETAESARRYRARLGTSADT